MSVSTPDEEQVAESAEPHRLAAPSTQFKKPLPLYGDDEPTQKVRCPIHGFIHYSKNERKIIDHPLLMRLRAIRQLALTEYVYPGATHTRFEHSLGVMEVATRAFDSLCSRHGAMIEDHFKKLPYFEDRPLDRARQILRIAALLHDSGHAPFSHAAESVIQKQEQHDQLSIRIITSDEIGGIFRGLRPLLDSTWGERTAEMAAALVGKDTPASLRFLRELISGEIDADRTDYLLRDSLHCGVSYGRFDSHQLIESLALVMGDGGVPEVALTEGGLQTYEALLLARFQMNTQVYYHRVRRIYDHYLKQYHLAIRQEAFRSSADILKENDFTMLTRIQRDAEDTKALGHVWAKRIAERRHHVDIYSGGILVWNEKGGQEEKRIRLLYEKLEKECPDVDLVLDLCEETKPISLHKLMQAQDSRSSDKATERRVMLVRRNGTKAQLGFESPLLGYIPRQFKMPRIYADAKNCILGRTEARALSQETIDEAQSVRSGIRKTIAEKALSIINPLGD